MLHGLDENEAFKQELMEEYQRVLMAQAVIPLTAPHYQDNCILIKGQLMALTWVLYQLPKLTPKHKPQARREQE